MKVKIQQGNEEINSIDAFLAYPKDIRKAIYTTNAIKSTNPFTEESFEDQRHFAER